VSVLSFSASVGRLFDRLDRLAVSMSCGSNLRRGGSAGGAAGASPNSALSCGSRGALSMLIVVPELDGVALDGELRLLNLVVSTGSGANFLLTGVAGVFGLVTIGRIASRLESAPIMLKSIIGRIESRLESAPIML
jgi:hypothetical protein